MPRCATRHTSDSQRDFSVHHKWHVWRATMDQGSMRGQQEGELQWSCLVHGALQGAARWRVRGEGSAGRQEDGRRRGGALGDVAGRGWPARAEGYEAKEGRRRQEGVRFPGDSRTPAYNYPYPFIPRCVPSGSWGRRHPSAKGSRVFLLEGTEPGPSSSGVACIEAELLSYSEKAGAELGKKREDGREERRWESGRAGTGRWVRTNPISMLSIGGQRGAFVVDSRDPQATARPVWWCGGAEGGLRSSHSFSGQATSLPQFCPVPFRFSVRFQRCNGHPKGSWGPKAMPSPPLVHGGGGGGLLEKATGGGWGWGWECVQHLPDTSPGRPYVSAACATGCRALDSEPRKPPLTQSETGG